MAKSQAEFQGADAEAVAERDDPIVNVRVLKKGDGKISTGNHSSRGGEELYEFKDEFQIVKSIADQLEERGYIEILEAVKKPAEKAA